MVVHELTLLQTTHLVVNNVEKTQDSYKSRMARKWGIPVVSMEFVSRCLEEGKLLEVDSFIVVGKTAAQEFSSGKIIGMWLCSYLGNNVTNFGCSVLFVLAFCLLVSEILTSTCMPICPPSCYICTCTQ